MRHVLLLRGINLGPRNRISMPDLRVALERAGLGEARTYLQSGNVVVSSHAPAAELSARARRAIAGGFGLEVDVLVRTRHELAEIVARDPLGEIADNPKRYQVSFLERELGAEVLRQLSGLAAASEGFVAIGRELYAWHPDGVARSRLWTRLAGRQLGVSATSRNWTTVTKLLAMADA